MLYLLEKHSAFFVGDPENPEFVNAYCHVILKVEKDDGARKLFQCGLDCIQSIGRSLTELEAITILGPLNEQIIQMLTLN